MCRLFLYYNFLSLLFFPYSYFLMGAALREGNRRRVAGWMIAFTCLGAFILTYAASELTLLWLVEWQIVIVFLKLHIQ